MFVALLITTPFAFQEPAPSPKPVEPPATAVQTVEVWDDKTAKARVAEFQKLTKGSPSMAERNRALDELAGGSNKQLVRPLARVVETDKSVVIKKRAAELLGNQPEDAANDAILKLIDGDAAKANPPVMGELIRSLSRCGYEPKQWDTIDRLFEADYDPKRVAVHEAILELITTHKEKQALPLLLRNMDEPAPENVDDARNPPAEYWEKRWHSWAAWKGKVKDALFAITGQRFTTADEAKAWLKKNPLK